MPYALAFAEEFFIHDDVDRIPASDRPVSAYQAILGLQEDALREIAREVFGLAAKSVSPEMVLEKILETDTCSNLDDPVEVWIDADGDYTLGVYSPASPLPVAPQASSS